MNVHACIAFSNCGVSAGYMGIMWEIVVNNNSLFSFNILLKNNLFFHVLPC